MKKLLVVLLSLGLIVAFSTAASAVDVKFSGSYYAVGVYESNPKVNDNGYSEAYIWQRFRLQPVFTVAEGLVLTTRFDALEKQWGNTNFGSGAGQPLPSDRTDSRRVPYQVNGSSAKIQEDIEFERAYVTFRTAIGQFDVGYMNVDDWGTDFGDYSNTGARVQFATQLGPVIFLAIYEKLTENQGAYWGNGVNPVTGVVGGANPAMVGATDADRDVYSIGAIYKAQGIETGLLYQYYAMNGNRPLGVKTQLNHISPYVKATFGPIYIEGEAQYWFGKFAQYEGALAGMPDVDEKGWGAYFKVRGNVGPAYVGGLFAYVSGDDLTDPTESTSSPGGGGTNFEPCLILMNDWVNTWNANGAGVTTNSIAVNPNLSTQNPITTHKTNVIIYNAFAGINPMPKLNMEAGLTYATVAEKALSRSAAGVVTNADSDVLGWEFDLKATYKIYDNLTYMVGAGYLWTGDYFKGANANATVSNDYLLMNQLTLSF
jgi:hypothetical protein